MHCLHSTDQTVKTHKMSMQSLPHQLPSSEFQLASKEFCFHVLCNSKCLHFIARCSLNFSSFFQMSPPSCIWSTWYVHAHQTLLFNMPCPFPFTGLTSLYCMRDVILHASWEWLGNNLLSNDLANEGCDGRLNAALCGFKASTYLCKHIFEAVHLHIYKDI